MWFYEKLKKWAMTDAKWYQFWMPQSGTIGGLIFGMVTISIISLMFIYL